MWSQTCWYRTITPAFGRLKQEDHKFEANLGHITRFCLKTPPALKKKERSEDSIWDGATAVVESRASVLHIGCWLHERGITRPSWPWSQTVRGGALHSLEQHPQTSFSKCSADLAWFRVSSNPEEPFKPLTLLFLIRIGCSRAGEREGSVGKDGCHVSLASKIQYSECM